MPLCVKTCLCKSLGICVFKVSVCIRLYKLLCAKASLCVKASVCKSSVCKGVCVSFCVSVNASVYKDAV